MNHMYSGVKTWNPYVGCRFNCVYCVPSFQRQAKRRKKWCEKCYNYEPHFHPERLSRVPNAKTIFACAYGDIAFASLEWLEQIIDVIKKHPDKEFYLQSKDPTIFEKIAELGIEFPDNLVLGTTIETDDNNGYWKISKAPFTYKRYQTLAKLDHDRKYVTIEPILLFRKAIFVRWIKKISPEFVYIGYANHNVKLPEPTLEETQELIDELEKVTEVRLKTIRPAWFEQNSG